MLVGDPNEEPSMLAVSWTVILLFLMTSSFTFPRFYHCLLMDFSCIQHCEWSHTNFELGKLVKACVLAIACSLEATLNISEAYSSLFCSVKWNFCPLALLSSLMYSRDARITDGTTHTCIFKKKTQQSHVMQPCSEHETTRATSLWRPNRGVLC
jgi:hypothetical protein